MFQIIADILLMFCVHAIGIIAYYFSDKLQRKAFLEIRVSLSMKVVIEEGSREQVGQRSNQNEAVTSCNLSIRTCLCKK